MKNSDYINKNGFFIGLPTKRIKKALQRNLLKKLNKVSKEKIVITGEEVFLAHTFLTNIRKNIRF